MSNTYGTDALELTDPNISAVANLTPTAPSRPAPSGQPDLRNFIGRELESMPGPLDPTKRVGLEEDLTDIKYRQSQATTRQAAENQRLYEQNRQVMTQAFNAEQATINSTPKWDVDAERKKYHTDPFESFGSFATTFAIIASAFTRDPMVNSLNAAAAAMQAKRDNNEFEYNLHYKAWEDNTNLAIKRFNMQHAAMQDAFKIGEVDTARGNAKLLETMTRFNDEKGLALYHAGLYPEIMEVETGRAKAIENLMRPYHQLQQDAMAERRVQDQERRTQLTENRDAIRAEIERNKIQAASERDEAKLVELKANRERLERQFLDTFRQKDEHFNTTVDQRQQTIDERVRADKAREAGTGGAVTPGRLQAREINRKYQEDVAKLDPEDPEYNKKLDALGEKLKKDAQLAVTPMSGNQRDRLQRQVSQYDQGIRDAQRALKLLGEAPGRAGLGGKVARPGETMLNFVGATNSTGYNQFAEAINELRLRGDALLKQADSSSSPRLKSAYNLIEQIIPGIQLGSSVQNTRESIKHILEEYERFRQNTLDRIGGADGSSPTVAAPDASETKPRWQSAPLKK